MPIERYGDSEIVPVWNPQKSEPDEKELSLKKSNEWISSVWYWCPNCDFAVCSEDLPEELEEDQAPLCPECRCPMEDFDWEGELEILGDGGLSSDDNEDEESEDTMFGDDD